MNATRRPRIRSAAPRGFTLIELIGVLAIIAIMASMLAPNMLRSIDRAAVRAEGETLARLGDQFERYVRERVRLDPATPATWLPTQANWATAVATYSDLATTDLTANKRRINRVFAYDTSSSPAPRALILSSMRTGLNLPSAATVSSNFQTIWQTPDDLVPSTLNWAGWSAVANSGDHLVIERINLQLAYVEEGRTFTVALNNTTASAASYRRNGGSAVALPTPGSITLTQQRSGDRIDLYIGSATAPNYSHVVGSQGGTLVFDGTQWRPD